MSTSLTTGLAHAVRAGLALLVIASAGLAAPVGPALAADEASPAPGDLSGVKARGELRIGADPSAGAPYFLKVGAGFGGFEAALGQAIAKRIGVKAVFIVTPWRELLSALKSRRIDIALNALETRPEANITFSNPYYMASQAILVRRDNQRIYTLQDLKGRQVATADGSVASAILSKLKPPAKTRLFADTEGPFKDLAAGKSEAVLLESAMVRHHAHVNPKAFRVAGVPVLPKPYAAALQAGDKALLAAVNQAIMNLTTNGEHQRILKAHGLWDNLQAGAPAPVASPAAPAARTGRRHRRYRHH